eukprot:scaffold53011_cov36-Tisochrysis_lutea.AAC.5
MYHRRIMRVASSSLRSTKARKPSNMDALKASSASADSLKLRPSNLRVLRAAPVMLLICASCTRCNCISPLVHGGESGVGGDGGDGLNGGSGG